MGGVLSAIAAGPQPINIDPTLALKRRILLGDAQAQQQERLAQAQNLQLKAQLQQRNLQNQSYLSAAFRDAEGDPEKTKQLARQYGADVTAIDAFDEAHQKLIDQRIAAGKSQNELAIQQHDQARAGLEQIRQIPDEQQKAQAYQQWLAGPAKQYLNPQEFAAWTQTHPQYTNDADLGMMSAALNTGSKVAEEANKRIEAQTKATEAGTQASREAREAERQAAELPGIKADAQRKQMIAKAVEDAQKDPMAGSSAIDAALPPNVDALSNSAYKAAWSAAMRVGNVDGAAKIVEAAANHAASISPAKQQFGVNEAVAKAQAEAPIKVAESVAQAKAMNGTGPTSNVPPHLAPTAIAAYNKAGQSLATAQTAAEEVQKVLDAAESGNKAAGANVPLVGVGALNAVNGIKRINSAEIHQYGTAGSLLDKIQGKLQGWVTGQPIPKDVLDDMRDLHKQLAEGAQVKHEREIQSINQSYGSSFQPMKFEAPAKSASATHRYNQKTGKIEPIQ